MTRRLRTATRNANKHTARGLSALQTSLQSDGWIGAMTTAADGEMIAGSARLETAQRVLAAAEPIIIESDGSRPIVVVRTDIPTADDQRAQRLALADNRIAQLDLSWDVEVLVTQAEAIGDLWNPQELSDLGAELVGEQPPPEVEFREYDESVEKEVKYCECPKCGHKWPA